MKKVHVGAADTAVMWPIWFKLLEQRERERGFALTFPFLIGAGRSASDTPPDQEPFAELLSLLRSMRDEAPESDYVRISECDRLHQPVANKMSSYFKPGVGFELVPSPLPKRSSLFVQVKYMPGGIGNIESVAEALWEVCGWAVLERRFTFKDGVFVPFSPEDVAFISRATALSDPR